MQLITEPSRLYGLDARQGDPRRLGDLPHQVRQGHAGRVSPGARRRWSVSGPCRRRNRGSQGKPMGKVTGFLEYDRQEQKYQLAGDRIRHFREFTLPLDDNDLKKQAARCMDCGIPFCHGPTGCPVHNQIPDWNDLVYPATGRRPRATCTPPTTSRNSPAASARRRARKPARSTSRTSRSPSRPSSRRSPTRPGRWAGSGPSRRRRSTGKRVAVIGSGPAGMAAAQQLARVGHEVHVFEREPKPGGLLRYGIPDFKMEKHHIDRRVKQMEAEGVVFHCGVNVGVDEALRLAARRVRRGALRRRRGGSARPEAAGPGSRGRALRDALSRPAEPAHGRRGGRRDDADPRRAASTWS